MKQLYIRHHKEECFGVGPRLCLLVSNEEEGPYERFYDTIDGFSYRWGFDHVIRVQETPVSGPAQDASGLMRRLAEVVEQIPRNGVEFELTLTPGEGRIREEGEGIFQFYEERTFQLLALTERKAMREALQDHTRIAFVFEHPPDPTLPLIVRSWRIA